MSHLMKTIPSLSAFTRTACLAVLLAFGTGMPAQAQTADPLPSWNEGQAKQAIIDFVRRTTSSGGKDFVAEADRIATFDNDGTLWIEQPIYTQVAFAFDRVKTLAPKHPEWRTQEPFKTLLSGDREAMSTLTLQDIEKMIAVTHSGMSVEAFQGIVKDWLATAKDTRFGRRYTELVYQPMLEVMRYLREHGYKTYIVTGGGQEFVRAFASQVYGVPPEEVIGSAGKTKYEYDANGKPHLMKLPEVLLIDDQAGKPESINLIIGRRPRAAFGNSTGDRQMLEWTQAEGGGGLMALVHHDDAKREFAYGPDSKIGTFSEELMNEAKTKGWTVISMKNDWKRIFP